MDDSKPILVATDFSDSADLALRQADGLARARGSKLLVCHVLPEMFQVHPLFPQLNLQEAFELPKIQRRAADAIVARTTEVTGRGEDDFEVVLAMGSAHHGILEQARDLDVATIVVGADGGGLAAALGSVVRRVVRHAPCDVLVARRASADGGILTGTDFSEASRIAVDRAAAEAKASGKSLSLVYALDFIPSGFAIPTVDVPVPSISVLDKMRGEMQRLLGAEAGRIGARAVMREGSAGVALCEAAKELGASLVVVGTHGRTGFGRLALGSVAETVVEHAPCSVLVVRQPHA